ncbi:uncharacterized protein FIBRA_05606 [Fibroporia radiculosa]|uniref:Uncharacterized protein n=1 Tax=Fibroporia radiculosa TaxID=599839 RepID=J4G9T1_9APHY|nr:uncharacterized protein FIBRA_05606 [Fibroporia radiculosa]CCM03473.1 predicted protein [Fibroporia radiculosa]
MAPVSLLAASVASVYIESLLYGILFVLSVASLSILIRRREELINSPVNARVIRQAAIITPMSLAALFLFITNTAHWILGVYRGFQAFVLCDGGTLPTEYLSDMRKPTEIVQISLLMSSLIIGDAMIIYRLWIVWGYTWFVIIFPVGTLVGLAVGIVVSLAMLLPGQDIFDTAAGQWITANCVFTLCTNVYSTGFIAWRIWRATRSAKQYGGSSLMGVMGILIESAALYTAWTILFFVTYHTRSNLQYTFSETYCAIAGIAFMSINVRVGLGWAQRAHNDSSDIASGAGLGPHEREQSFAMGRVAVNITRVVHRDDGSDEPPIKFASDSSLDLRRPRSDSKSDYFTNDPQGS